MKRILPAFLIAILCHVFLFVIDPGWLLKKPYKVKKSAITISMSYKKKPEPPPAKEPPKEIIKKKKIKVIEKAEDPDPVNIKKKVPEPVIEKAVTEEEIEIGEEAVNKETVIREEFEEARVPAEEKAPDVVIEAMPLYKINPEPEYPRMAKKRKYEGTVILSVLVNKEGLVDNLWVFETSGYNMLDNAALKAVREWIFEPGRKGSETVEQWVEVPVRFELK